jgi:hypothetical protein
MTPSWTMWGIGRRPVASPVFVALVTLFVGCTPDTRRSTLDGGAAGAGMQGEGGAFGAGGAQHGANASAGVSAATSGGAGTSTAGGRAGVNVGGGGASSGASSAAGGAPSHAGSDSGVGIGGTSDADGSVGAGGFVLPPHPDAGRDIWCYVVGLPSDDDAAHATAYTLGSEAPQCISRYDDVDFYTFKTPPGPPGYVVASVYDVGQYGMQADFYVGNTQHRLFYEYGGMHQSFDSWFAVAPSTQVWIKVSSSSSSGIAPYTLEATFTPVVDQNEPNDDKSTATALTLGKVAQGLMFAGYPSDLFPGAGGEFDDFFQVTVQQGTATVTVTNVPSDMPMEGYMFPANPQDPSYGSGASNAGTLKFTTEVMAAGLYYVVLQPYNSVTAYGSGAIPPSYATQPYTIVVTQ